MTQELNKIRITIPKRAFNKKFLFYSNSKWVLRKIPVKCYVWNVPLYTVKTEIGKQEQKTEASEMCV